MTTSQMEKMSHVVWCMSPVLTRSFRTRTQHTCLSQRLRSTTTRSHAGSLWTAVCELNLLSLVVCLAGVAAPAPPLVASVALVGGRMPASHIGTLLSPFCPHILTPRCVCRYFVSRRLSSFSSSCSSTHAHTLSATLHTLPLLVLLRSYARSPSRAGTTSPNSWTSTPAVRRSCSRLPARTRRVPLRTSGTRATPVTCSRSALLHSSTSFAIPSQSRHGTVGL